MSSIGDALLESADPPIRALYVYNSNPVAVAPESAKVVAGFSRDDLFCVVHEIFQTDTADYADIVLPATTQLEKRTFSSTDICTRLPTTRRLAARAKPNTEVFRLPPGKGLRRYLLRDSDDDLRGRRTTFPSARCRH
jgi:anaerobic selenocysteine-containing dehydrogenase